MEKTLSIILIIFGLLIGAVCGAVLAPSEEVITEIEVEKLVEVIKEVEVPVEVPSASAYLDLAVEDFMKHVDDKELFKCKKNEYNFAEISISRIYDNYNLDLDKDEYIVNFKIKLEYDEDEEKSCYKTFNVEAYYDDEDVEISI